MAAQSFLNKAPLKLIVDIGTLLIGTESARLQQEKPVKGDDTVQVSEEARPPAFAELLKSKSTGTFTGA
jgi:hypothetical protein